MRDDYRHPWREVVRSLWFLPSVFVVDALVAGYGLSSDARVVRACVVVHTNPDDSVSAGIVGQWASACSAFSR
jgi:hypothetical protein